MAATLSSQIPISAPTPANYGSQLPTAAFDPSQRKPPEPAEWPIDPHGSASTTRRLDVRLSQDDLFPITEAFRPEHGRAIKLLAEAVAASKRALDATVEDSPLVADYEMQQVQVVLPELFCCRALGDGFATIVNSLLSSFEGLAGNLPSADQIRMISRALGDLKQRPFLSVDDADQEIELLESVGLTPYPPELVGFLSSD